MKPKTSCWDSFNNCAPLGNVNAFTINLGGSKQQKNSIPSSWRHPWWKHSVLHQVILASPPKPSSHKFFGSTGNRFSQQKILATWSLNSSLPEKWWLEVGRLVSHWEGNFSRASCLTSGRVYPRKIRASIRIKECLVPVAIALAVPLRSIFCGIRWSSWRIQGWNSTISPLFSGAWGRLKPWLCIVFFGCIFRTKEGDNGSKTHQQKQQDQFFLFCDWSWKVLGWFSLE